MPRPEVENYSSSLDRLRRSGCKIGVKGLCVVYKKSNNFFVFVSIKVGNDKITLTHFFPGSDLESSINDVTTLANSKIRNFFL